MRDLFVEQYAAFQHELTGISQIEFVGTLVELDGHGLGSKPEIFAQVSREWNLRAGMADRLLRHFWTDYDSTLRVDPAVPRLRLPEDTRVTLDALRHRGKKLGVITNGETIRQRKKLEMLGVTSVFDTVLISETEGVRKPEREIFERALHRCDVEAHEAVFVGDHPDADMEGARSAGLRAIWKYVPYWTLSTDEVTTVHRLTEILPLCV